MPSKHIGARVTRWTLQVSRMVKEMHRVLKPGGAYIVISHGIPTTRLGYLNGNSLQWSVEYQQIRERGSWGGGVRISRDSDGSTAAYPST